MQSRPVVSIFLVSVILVSLIGHCGGWGGTIHAPPNDDKTAVGTYFRHKTVMIPDDSKLHRGGEDAAAGSDTVLVVADGVGGWIRQNVDPGHYSRLLTHTILELATITATTTTQQSLTPSSSSSSSSSLSSSLTDDDTKRDKQKNERSLIEIVHEANWIAANQHLGSATCTTLKLTGPLTLSTLNIGDSGYSIHRVGNHTRHENQNIQKDEKTTATNNNNNFQLVFASEPAQKSFNFPYQIGGKHGDVVADVAVLQTHNLEPRDIIVVYSDGVSDNMDPLEFHKCLDAYLKDENDDDDDLEEEDDDDGDDGDDDNLLLFSSLSVVADCIARTAYELGKNKNFDSPFAKGARAVGKRYMGGKADDISVIVAQVFVGKPPTRSSSSSSSTSSSSDEKEDPHYAEAVYLYTGPVPPLADLPDRHQFQRTTRKGRSIKMEL